MASLIWSNDALQDLNAIAEYIAQDSPVEAQHFVQKVFEKAGTLLKFPRRNRRVPEKNLNQLREILFKNYRIVYEIKANENIEILIVIHQKRILRF